MTSDIIQVLYIEDNRANTQLIRSVFKRIASIKLYDVADATTGIKLFGEIKPEIILMDIDLPEMSGKYPRIINLTFL